MNAQMSKMGIKRPHLTGEEMSDIAAYLQKLSHQGLRDNVYLRPGNAVIGKKIFADKKCNVCHTNQKPPKGIPAAPDLSADSEYTSVLAIVSAMWNHGSEMAQSFARLNMTWPQFSGEEMADLITYICYLKFNNIDGDRDNGKEVFRGKSCFQCHTLDKKQVSASLHFIQPVESPLEMVVLMWNHAVIMHSSIAKAGLIWPEFNIEEMKELYLFLKGQ